MDTHCAVVLGQIGSIEWGGSSFMGQVAGAHLSHDEKRRHDSGYPTSPSQPYATAHGESRSQRARVSAGSGRLR